MNRLQTFAARILGVPTQPPAAGPLIAPRFAPGNLASSATASTVQQAIRSAETGDPTNLFRLYRDSLLSDDHIQGCLNMRKLAVLGQAVSVMPRNRNQPDDVLAAAACNRAIEDCENWSDALGAMMDSCIWPVVVMEKIFRPAGTPNENEPALQWTLHRLEPVDPFLFCFKWAYQPGVRVDPAAFEPYLRLWPVDESGAIGRDVSQATALDLDRHMAFRGHLLAGFRDNWGGAGRALLGWWLLRSLSRDWFGQFMERYGMPIPKGRTDRNDAQAVSFMQEAFSLAVKVGGFVIDREDEVELVSAAVQGGAEGHKLWHDVCNNSIRRHITGIDTSSSPAGLNAGESKTGESVREDVRMFDAMKLAETLGKKLFSQFLRINGLSGRVRVSFGGLSDSDSKLFADTIKTYYEAGWEPDDAAMMIMNERAGFTLRRRAAAPASPSPFQPEIQTFSAHPHTAIRNLQSSDPVDPIATANAREVGDAMASTFAPVMRLIRESHSASDAQARVRAYFASWRPKEFVSALEKPLQLCAASGAVSGQAQPGK